MDIQPFMPNMLYNQNITINHENTTSQKGFKLCGMFLVYERIYV